MIASIVMVALFTFPVHANEVELKTAKLTCYCPPTFPEGQLTAMGTPVRFGVIASTREHLGDAAIIWTYDDTQQNNQGECIGIFKCEDIGGTKAINNGYVIDMWVESLQHVKYMTLRTGGKVVIQYIENVEG